MSLVGLPDDILLHIYSLLDVQSMQSLRCSSKRLCKFIGMKHIAYDSSISLKRFLELVGQSKNTLKSIKAYGTSGLDLPISTWPETVVFDRCSVGNTPIIRPICTKTEKLIIRDIHRVKTSKTLRIDWRKFSRLRILDLYVRNVDLTGISSCKELEAIRIDIMQGVLPSEIGKLPKLKMIATNCSPSDNLHFDSDQLKVCFVPGGVKITANSSIVPATHLDGSYGFVNIQCFEPEEYC